METFAIASTILALTLVALWFVRRWQARSARPDAAGLTGEPTSVPDVGSEERDSNAALTDTSMIDRGPDVDHRGSAGEDRPAEEAAADEAPPTATDPTVYVSISVPNSSRATVVRSLLARGIALDDPDTNGPAELIPDPGASGRFRRRKIRFHTVDGPSALDTLLDVLDGMGFRVDHADAHDIVLRGWEVGEARVALRSAADVESMAPPRC